VRVFEVDEEGNEVPIADLRTRQDPKPADKSSAAGRAKPQRGSARARTLREVPPPSWHRAFRRGGVMGALMLFAFLFLFRNNASLGLRVAWGLFYALAFIPLTYWIDRTAHRTYLKRLARQSAPKPEKKR